MIDVKAMIERVVAGKMSAQMCGDMLAKEFKGAPAAPERTKENADVVMRRDANSNVEEYREGTLDELHRAYVAGDLSDEDYATIAGALTGDTNA